MTEPMTEAALRRLTELESLVARLGDAVLALRQARDDEAGRAAALERELAMAEARLMVETMHSAGLAAQATHLLSVGAEQALSPAGEGGKTVLTLVYEQAFDSKGRELGVPSPESFRAA
ncbi:hypothetical protein NON00_23885 [Roseomonas sp. GC11]|uniref:hypothetical protein n=1 Tax=Roseomonas sp. GC11 TaxID=2950546 RepID=UPI0021093502|nr:hypothetical protein [Roseomonas sp. GC11]MCQ4162944.1 hypothetical protein [Roseomonas sp. GC11]